MGTFVALAIAVSANVAAVSAAFGALSMKVRNLAESHHDGRIEVNAEINNINKRLNNGFGERITRMETSIDFIKDRMGDC